MSLRYNGVHGFLAYKKRFHIQLGELDLIYYDSLCLMTNI